MLKRLINPETDVYNDEGKELDHEISKQVGPIFEKYASAGYSMRDLAIIFIHNISIQESTQCLIQGVKRWKAKQAAAIPLSSGPETGPVE